MRLSFEQEIGALIEDFRSGDSLGQAVQNFYLDLDIADQRELLPVFCNFLLASGQYSRLVEFILSKANEGGFEIPWAQLIEAVDLHIGFIPYEIAEPIWEGIEKSVGQARAAQTLRFDSFSPVLRQLRADLRLEQIKNFNQRKDELLVQLQIAVSQRLSEQENKIIAQLKSLCPSDNFVTSLSENLKDRSAAEILNRHQSAADGLRSKFKAELNSPELILVRGEIQKEILTLAGTKPEWIYDLVIAAHMIGLDTLALSLCDEVVNDPRVPWLKLEILFTSRKYLIALQEALELESLHPTDAEVLFATTYLRARCFHALGKKEKALELMESICASRPGYRAAAALLAEWRSS